MTTTVVYSKPIFWKNLIKYQKGSVVSREIVKKSTSTVTLFAFDKNQGLSEHTTPFDALVQILDVKGEFTIDGVSHTIGKGEMLLMPAGYPHKVVAQEKFIMLLTMIKE